MRWVVLAMFCFMFGVVVGERKGQFFRPWYDDGQLYVGDRVLFTEGSGLSNSCEKMTLLDMQAIQEANVGWILMEECEYGLEYYQSTVATVDMRYLVKEKK